MKAKLRNKKTQDIAYLDDSYVKIFPDTWELAAKKAAAPAAPAASATQGSESKKEGK